MSIALAIKRSYRNLLCLEVIRKQVRELWIPAFWYLLGITTGMTTYGDPAERARMNQYVFAGFLLLIVVRLWLGKPESMTLEA